MNYYLRNAINQGTDHYEIVKRIAQKEKIQANTQIVPYFFFFVKSIIWERELNSLGDTTGKSQKKLFIFSFKTTRGAILGFTLIIREAVNDRSMSGQTLCLHPCCLEPCRSNYNQKGNRRIKQAVTWRYDSPE